jgi:CBS domain-containing protein
MAFQLRTEVDMKRGGFQTDQLPIQVRRTMSGGGGVAEAMSVRCARRKSSVALEDCIVCEYCAGVERSAEGELVFNCAYREELGAKGEVEQNALLLDAAAARSAEEVRVSAVMTPAVACARPDLDLDSVARLLLDLGVGGLPVVDEDGHPIGIISKTDLIRYQGENRGGHEIRTEDAMTPIAFSVLENTALSNAAALMAFEGVHRLPVTNEDDHVVGILSALDIVRWLAESHGYRVPHRHSRGL